MVVVSGSGASFFVAPVFGGGGFSLAFVGGDRRGGAGGRGFGGQASGRAGLGTAQDDGFGDHTEGGGCDAVCNWAGTVITALDVIAFWQSAGAGEESRERGAEGGVVVGSVRG